MTTKEFVNIDVSLILLRHGRTAVLSAIAHQIGMSEKELTGEIERLRAAKQASIAKKNKRSNVFDLEAVLVGGDEKTGYLRSLSDRFDNRTFLPELKDLRRFLERHGNGASFVKSRANAKTKLFRILATLSELELEKISIETHDRPRVSSLGLISDEILGRTRKHEVQKNDVTGE